MDGISGTTTPSDARVNGRTRGTHFLVPKHDHGSMVGSVLSADAASVDWQQFKYVGRGNRRHDSQHDCIIPSMTGWGSASDLASSWRFIPLLAISVEPHRAGGTIDHSSRVKITS